MTILDTLIAAEVRRGLTPVPRSRPQWITYAITAAARAFYVDSKDIPSPKRDPDSVDARHVAAWVMRQRDMSYPQIGRALNRDHTTIIYGCRRVDGDDRLRYIAERITSDGGV